MEHSYGLRLGRNHSILSLAWFHGDGVQRFPKFSYTGKFLSEITESEGSVLQMPYTDLPLYLELVTHTIGNYRV